MVSDSIAFVSKNNPKRRFSPHSKALRAMTRNVALLVDRLQYIAQLFELPDLGAQFLELGDHRVDSLAERLDDRRLGCAAPTPTHDRLWRCRRLRDRGDRNRSSSRTLRRSLRSRSLVLAAFRATATTRRLGRSRCGRLRLVLRTLRTSTVTRRRSRNRIQKCGNCVSRVFFRTCHRIVVPLI